MSTPVVATIVMAIVAAVTPLIAVISSTSVITIAVLTPTVVITITAVIIVVTLVVWPLDNVGCYNDERCMTRVDWIWSRSESWWGGGPLPILDLE